jgi:uncharacterized membrane protein (UPF0127 family)
MPREEYDRKANKVNIMDEMVIMNLDKKTCLATKIQKADTPFTRSRGLLGQKCINENEAMWIVPCKGVHTIGLRFAIDVIFLDKGNRVIYMIPHMKKNRISPVKPRAQSVLELSPGTIHATGTEIGDQLSIELSVCMAPFGIKEVLMGNEKGQFFLEPTN